MTSSPSSIAVFVMLVLLVVLRAYLRVKPFFESRDPVRLFPAYERAVIFARAGGRCEHHAWITGRCRETTNLEADHVHPHSRGGQTALANGQALCRRHNRRKWTGVPNVFQLRALERRRTAYFPEGVSGKVIRRAPRRAA